MLEGLGLLLLAEAGLLLLAVLGPVLPLAETGLLSLAVLGPVLPLAETGLLSLVVLGPVLPLEGEEPLMVPALTGCPALLQAESNSVMCKINDYL